MLIENIKIITLFCLAFFAMFLFTYKKGNRRLNVLLGLVYAYQALEALNASFYRFFDFWAHQFPWVFYTTEITFFLWGPTIYFFFKIALDTSFRLRKKDLWHTIPAVIHTVFLLLKFHIYSNEIKTEMLQSGVMSVEEDFVIHFLRNASVIIYLVASANIFFKSEKSSDSNKSWLGFFLGVFIIVELIQIFHFIDLETRTFNTLIYNTTSIMWFLVALTTLYKALKNPYFFVQEKMKTKDAFELDKEEFSSILDKLKTQFLDHELFLNPDLNLSSLAKAILEPTKKVSYVVNEHYGQNISDFINSARIEKAKASLLDQTQQDKTIIEIAYEVGFNSKATFNRAFTKFTQLSPSEFKLKHS